jgi:predicted RNA-binding Zn-ribbon protein involved in translation (DUF1610 family)
VIELAIEYVTFELCVKCGSFSFEEISFNEIHGHLYHCPDCGYKGWGGRKHNEEKNKKRPPCPTAEDLRVYQCDICTRQEHYLGYSETLEVHHRDGDPANNDRLNLWVLCTVCHKLVHHQRTYRGEHFMQKFGDVL